MGDPFQFPIIYIEKNYLSLIVYRAYLFTKSRLFHSSSQGHSSMHLTITDRSGSLTAAQQDLIQRRVLFALSRFDTRLRRVVVVICDENGPRGELDTTCVITARLQRLGEVIVSETSEDTSVSISRAAERIGRAVQRRIERRRFDEWRSPSRVTERGDSP